MRQDVGEGEAIMSGPDDWIGEEVLVAVGSGRIRGYLESFDERGIVLLRTDEQGTESHSVFYPMTTIGWMRRSSEQTPN
jgi:hypothetical protein